MSIANGKKSEGKPTVAISGQQCVLCEKTVDTVLLNSARNRFRGVVCAEHQFALLRKWQKQKERRPVESLHEQQCREICHYIVELEDRLRTEFLSLSREHRLRSELAVLYDLLKELWPIVPGRGSREEPGCC